MTGSTVGVQAVKRKRPATKLWVRVRDKGTGDLFKAMQLQTPTSRMKVGLPLARGMLVHFAAFASMPCIVFFIYSAAGQGFYWISPLVKSFHYLLPSRQLYVHKIQVHHPRLQTRVMAGQHRSRQIIKALTTGVAVIALAVELALILATLAHVVRLVVLTMHALGPALRPKRLITPRIAV